MEIIDNYLDQVCGYIASAPHRRAVRRELRNHMEDSMEISRKSGIGSEEAAERAIAEMGDAQETGRRLNRQFPVRPNIRLVGYILGIFFLYTAAGLTIHFSLSETILTLLAYTVGICLYLSLRKLDLEGNFRLIKYLYFGTLLFCSAAGFSADANTGRECLSAGGVILFFCVTFFVYRLHKNNWFGLAAALVLFLLPVPLFLFFSAYASLFLYMTAGVYTFLYFMLRGWTLKNRDKLFFCLCIAAAAGITVISCRFSLFTRLNLWDHFFLRDGQNHFPYLAEHYSTYPLAACISRYGIWTAVIYILLFLLILAELVRMAKAVHSFWGRNLLNCILLIFLIKGTFPILLNLGVPLTRYFTLPFAGFGFDQASNLLLIVLAEYVYCFGDAVFGDYSFFEESVNGMKIF